MLFKNLVKQRFFFLDPSEKGQEIKTVSKLKPPSLIISGLRKDLIIFYSKIIVIQCLVQCYKSPQDWIKGMKYLFKLRNSFLGNSRIRKIAQIEDKYYSSLFAPAINTAGFKTFIRSELNRFKKVKKNSNRFNHVFLAITTKCPLQCEHCYEWERLNTKENFNEEKLQLVIRRLQKEGVSEIHLSGGEPLLKFELILKLLEGSDKSDFWLNTSGYQLTNLKAIQLKKAGLRGVFISLDHYSEKEHNEFRKHRNSYQWALEAARNCVQNGLVVTLSLCVRKDIINEKNLANYLELARHTGVSFVQFLEPKPVGHYQNKNVCLKKEQIQILESFFEKYNFSKDYLEYPLICYHEYYQRRTGCLNTENRGLYIDSMGGINPCPFCHKDYGNILDDNYKAALQKLNEKSCSQVAPAPNQ